MVGPPSQVEHAIAVLITVVDIAQQFSAVQKQTEAVKYILSRLDTTATRTGFQLLQRVSPCSIPTTMLRPHGGRLCSLYHRPLLSSPNIHQTQINQIHQTPPEAGDPEIEGAALNQEVVIIPLLHLEEGQAENI